MSEPDIGRPEESSNADVTLVTSGMTVTACVDVSNEFALVVRPGGEGARWKTDVKRGDRVEVYWVSGYEERTLPAKISSVEDGEEPRWHLAATGPAERSQRRKSVRGRVALAVVMPWAGGVLTGQTVDLSEGGMKALFDGWGLPPEAGTRLGASLTLDEGGDVVDLHGEVVWHSARGAQWLMALRFHDVSEKNEDLLRRRVFRALREERAHAG